jgi:hypothetical protein
MKHYKLLFATLTIPSLSFAFFCPSNFNQIDFGMTVDQVIQSCGKPDSMKESSQQNDNVPQEWSYFIPQTVNMGGSSQNAQGTLKTTMVFDDKGKAINISVNGIGVGETSVCGSSSIQLGDDKDKVKAACGKPSFVNKQTAAANSTTPQEIKTVELSYTSANPPVTLVFEGGQLQDKK